MQNLDLNIYKAQKQKAYYLERKGTGQWGEEAKGGWGEGQ